MKKPLDQMCCTIIFLSQDRKKRITEEHAGIDWRYFHINTNEQALSCVPSNVACPDAMCKFDNEKKEFLFCNDEPWPTRTSL
jgi:hypothetical protein